MSLIASAELAGANPFEYLCALYQHAAQLLAEPSEWMPWNYRATLEGLETSREDKDV